MSTFPIIGALYESSSSGLQVRCIGPRSGYGWAGIVEKESPIGSYQKGYTAHSWNADPNHWILIDKGNQEKVNLYDSKRELATDQRS